MRRERPEERGARSPITVAHDNRHSMTDLDWTRLDGEVLVASGDSVATIRLWRLDGTLLRSIVSHNTVIASVRFSPDGTRLLSAARGGTARIWPVRSVELLALARKRAQRELTEEQEGLLRDLLDR